MGKILVGTAGSGKSIMEDAVQDLVNGPHKYKVYIYEEMHEDQLTFQHAVRGPDSLYKPLDVPLAMEDGDGFGAEIGFEETTQGRDDMLSFQNELLINHKLSDPRKGGVDLEGGPNFGIGHLINDPNSSEGVGEFKDDILERCIILRFNPMPPDKLRESLVGDSTVMTDTGEFQINPLLIGGPRKGLAGPDKKYPDGTEKYDGLIGLMQELNDKKAGDKLGKILPRNRSVGYRVLRDTLQMLFDKYEKYRHLEGLTPQYAVFLAFMSAFNLQGTDKQIQGWSTNILSIMEELKLFDPKAGETVPDAIEVLLNGDDIKVPVLGIIKEPESGYDELNKILSLLQKNTLPSSVRPNMTALRKEVGNWFKKDVWEKTAIDEKLKRVWALRRIYAIIKVIEAHRFDPSKSNGFAYTTKDQETLLGTIAVLKDFLAGKNWPYEKILAGSDDWREIISASQKDIDTIKQLLPDQHTLHELTVIGILSRSNTAMTVAPMPSDHAQASRPKMKAPGGINMDPADLDLQIKHDGNGIVLPVEDQDLENIKINGLVPVILNIKPVITSPLFAQLTSS